MSEKLKHYEDGFTTTVEKDGGREQEAVVNTEPGEIHSPEILAKDVEEIVAEADRKQDEHLLENYYDKDEMDELYYDKEETNDLLATKQDEIDGESIESGSVASMLGLDSEGNLVKGSIPAGSVVDSELDIDSTNPVENKAIAQGFADVENGTIVAGKSLTAEQLENVSEESGTVQDEPFIFQATGCDGGLGSTDTAPIAKQLELRGKTYALNQNCMSLTSNDIYCSSSYGDLSNRTTTSALYTRNSIEFSSNIAILIQTVVAYSTIANHTYLVKATVTPSSSFNIVPYVGKYGTSVLLTANVKNYVNQIITPTSNGYLQFISEFSNPLPLGGTCLFENVQLIDLTLLFNGNIPTEIINGITNVGGVSGLNISGVALFNSLFPEPYYAYGNSLVSSQASKLVNIGYNQFDEELEGGTIGQANGQNTPNANAVRSKNYIRVVPGQRYTLESALSPDEKYIMEYDNNNNFIKSNFAYASTTLTDNTHFIRFTFIKYNSGWSANIPNDLNACFHLTWDSSRTGYEEYVKYEYALPNEVLRSAGDVYDEIKPDGTKTVRVGTYTFTGSETFTDYSGSGVSLAMALSNAKTPSANNVVANMIWELGIVSTSNDINNSSLALGEYTIALSTSGYLYIRTTKNSSQLASALAGKTIQFELAEPTTSQVSTFAENVEVDDFGTMQFVSTYPQGNAFFYPADYVLFIDSLYNEVEGDVGNIALKSELLDVSTTLNTRIPALPSDSADGTYTLKATMSSGSITYAWVLDE